MIDEKELIEMDFDDFSPSDLLVLFIISDVPIQKNRIQKISLLYVEVYPEPVRRERPAYFSEGYSDEIDESVCNLVDIGMLGETPEGYVLTEYGRKIREYAKIRLSGRDDLVKGVPNIVKALIEIPDRNVVGLTYQFYSETAVKSSIKESVDKLNRRAVYNGMPLDDMSRYDFEQMLRNGTLIHMG